MQMAEAGHGLTIAVLKMKESEITMTRVTPFQNGIHEGGWMRGWRHRHPELDLHTSRALDSARVKGLCKESILSFCENLGKLYGLHDCLPPPGVEIG